MHACVCALHCFARMSCVEGPVALALCLSQATPCTTLPFTHTEALSSRAQYWLTDRRRRVGGVGRWGTKAFGWSNRVGEKLEKVCVCVHWVVWSFFGRPGYMCWVEGYSKHTVTPRPPLPPSLFLSCVRAGQQPVLCADCSVWVLRLWMLAVAMRHVLRILSLFVSSINTLSVYVRFMHAVVRVCLL